MLIFLNRMPPPHGFHGLIFHQLLNMLITQQQGSNGCSKMFKSRSCSQINHFLTNPKWLTKYSKKLTYRLNHPVCLTVKRIDIMTITLGRRIKTDMLLSMHGFLTNKSRNFFLEGFIVFDGGMLTYSTNRINKKFFTCWK